MDKEGLSKIDAALLITLLIGVSYGISYVFEWSYQGYYQLPSMFIDLNINTITKSLFLTLLLVGFIWILSHSLTGIIIKTDSLFGDIPPWAILFFIVLALYGAMFLGNFCASIKEEYMVIKQNKELFVVVTTYKDNLVIAPLDIKTETITPEFKLIEMKDMKNTEIIRFEDGLKVKDLKSSKDLKE
jgi:hypothetical protein